MRLAWLVFAGLPCLISCSDDGGGGPSHDPNVFVQTFSELPGALIGISGTSESDVWAVGGNPGDGSGAFVLHFDGKAWARRPTGQDVDLWWVHTIPAGPAFFGGSGGTILRFVGGAFEKMPTPGTATVFGIWGASADDLWAVGGDPAKPGNAFVWRWDGTSWASANGFPSVPISSWFKVWGRAANDVRFVGMDGAIVHFDGSTFTQINSPTNRRLLTLFAEPGGRYTAVGGVSQAVILEDENDTWTDVSPTTPGHAMIGIRTRGDDGYAAGTGGSVMRRKAGDWVDEPLGFDVFADFHSVWIDPKGGVWVAGGNILSIPLVNGILIHKGPKIPGGTYD
ncbi:MAG: hypothetical protein IPI67_27455 [Myxococcales bacterium]|nr:hypothetical protein [Myxococcales bacterium]